MPRRIRSSGSLSLALAVVFAVGCGPPALVPLVRTDPETPCPAGSRGWRLEVLDRRVDRDSSERLSGLLRDSVVRSFPGCDWSGGAAAPVITLEIHRFRVGQESDGSWAAAAEWTVLARDAAGRAVTEFPAEGEVFRPNYRGVNNEKEALTEAFRQAMERTLTGLRIMAAGGVSLAPETVRPGGRPNRLGEPVRRGNSPDASGLTDPGRTERNSQRGLAEVL
jgi:hypothetical protein